MSSSKLNDLDDVLNKSPQQCSFTVADFKHDRDADINRGRHLLGLLGESTNEAAKPEPTVVKPERTVRKRGVAKSNPNITLSQPDTTASDSKEESHAAKITCGVSLMDLLTASQNAKLKQDCQVIPQVGLMLEQYIRQGHPRNDVADPTSQPSTQSNVAATDCIISQGAGPEVAICEAHLRNDCQLKETCGLNHCGLLYLWQINVTNVGWQPLPLDVMVNIEKAFCDKVGANIFITQMALTYANGVTNDTQLGIDFLNMTGEFNHPPHLHGVQRLLQVRRLSTPSYGYRLSMKQTEDGTNLEVTDADRNTFFTQWRWYYQDGSAPHGWMMFELDGLTPHQAVLECKFLAGQEVFMFDVEASDGTMCILLNFKTMTMTNMKTKQVCSVKRRPILAEPNDVIMLYYIPWPKVEVNPFAQYIPSNWYPLATKCDFELIPINPEKLEFHLVAGEFYNGQQGSTINDIFRVQNPFLWHKYHCKRLQHEQKEKVKEVQAFHGTDSEIAVRSILNQNFDPRVAGKNATAYGQGCYFARDPAFSHKYTQPLPSSKQRIMFLARLLVGKYCFGQKSYRRPPPVDPKKPDGELYDSCVDKVEKPKIYVIFESDQCYPEYVINYTGS